MSDLWAKDKLLHLRDVARPHDEMYKEVFDPVKDAYGFDVDPDGDAYTQSDIQQEESVVHESREMGTSIPLATQLEDPPTNSGIASQLNATNISDYLRSLKLDQYIEEFFENDIDGDVMLTIDKETLEMLGVTTKMHQIKIKTKFRQWLANRPSQTK